MNLRIPSPNSPAGKLHSALNDISPMAKATAAAAAVLERKAFAIDEAKDDEDIDKLLGDGAGGEDDEGVLDEVDAFLQEHDSSATGLTDADKKAAKGALLRSLDALKATRTERIFSDLLSAAPMK